MDHTVGERLKNKYSGHGPLYLFYGGPSGPDHTMILYKESDRFLQQGLQGLQERRT